jgi:hypothetical protein
VRTSGTARNGIAIKSGAMEWVEFIDTTMTLAKKYLYLIKSHRVAEASIDELS